MRKKIQTDRMDRTARAGGKGTEEATQNTHWRLIILPPYFLMSLQ
jgi:hypothetical protein